MSDWTNISPSKPPKYKTLKDDDQPLRRKVGVDGVPGESPGPSDVFPRGQLVSPPVEIGGRVEEAGTGVFDGTGQIVGLPEKAEVVNRANHVFRNTNYEIMEVFVGDVCWYGFLVDSGLGMTFHSMPTNTDRDVLVKRHLQNPGIQKHYKEIGAKMPLVTSKTIRLLKEHGVADASQISEILHPQGLSLMESLIQQKAFIVTRNCKIIDIAAHEWPIDLEKAVDVRATVGSLVKLGSEVGEVAQTFGETVEFLTAGNTKVVPVQDLMPIMRQADETNSFVLLVKETNQEAAIAAATQHGFKDAKVTRDGQNGEMMVEGIGEYTQAANWLAEEPKEAPYPAGSLLWFKDVNTETASINKVEAAVNTWALHRISDAGEEKEWKQFPTEQSMVEFANSQKWAWNSQPDLIFGGYWVEEDGTSYMPDIKPQTGEVNNPQGLTGGQDVILNRGKR